VVLGWHTVSLHLVTARNSLHPQHHHEGSQVTAVAADDEHAPVEEESCSVTTKRAWQVGTGRPFTSFRIEELARLARGALSANDEDTPTGKNDRGMATPDMIHGLGKRPFVGYGIVNLGQCNVLWRHSSLGRP